MNGGSLIIAIIVWVFVSFFVRAAKQATVPRSPQRKAQPTPSTTSDAQVEKKRPSGFAESMRPFSADSDARARFAGYGGEQDDISASALGTQAEPSAPGPVPGLRLSFQANDAVQGIIYAEILARKAPIPRNQR